MHGPSWPYSSLAVGDGFGWTSWSLKLKEIVGNFPHGDGSVPREKEQSFKSLLESTKCYFRCILLVKQVTKPAQIQEFRERI